MFKLYYLINQSGDINGDKILKGSFSSLALAQAQAASDGVSHYSVELTDSSNTVTIVYVI